MIRSALFFLSAMLVALPSTAWGGSTGPELPPGRPIPLPAGLAEKLAIPMTIKRQNAAFPEEARVAGHHGAVIVAVTVAPSGTITDVAVTTSSRSPLLDAAAIDAARRSTFKAGISPGGEPVSGTVTLRYDFDDRAFDTYRCDQAVRDFAWWSSAWPDRDDVLKHRIGMQAWARALLKSGYSPRASEKASRIFEQGWGKALATCSATPTIMLSAALDQSGVVVPPPADWGVYPGYGP